MTTKADQLRTEAVATHVGIFYIVDGRVFLDSTEASTIRSPGKFISFNRSHVMYWDEIVANERPDMKGVHFAYCPRGRVTYFKDKEKYVIWLDECIADHEIEEIRSRMNLTPENSEIVVGRTTGQHYKCHGCDPDGYKNVMSV
jgi:hypothetical protein